MRLLSVRIDEAPGLPEGLVLDELGAGVQVVVGPNASGKSTLARLVRAALWSAPIDVQVRGELVFDDDGATRRARLAAGVVRWQPGPPGALPEDRERYALGLAELLSATATDQRLARQIGVELAGGDDPDAALATLGQPGWRQTGPARQLRDARDARMRAEADAAKLADDEAQLASFAEAIDAAVAAEQHAAVVALAREAVLADEDHIAAAEALAALPNGLAELAADAGAQVDAALEADRDAVDALGHTQVEHRAAEAEAAERTLPGLDEATLFDGALDARLEAASAAAARATRLQDEADKAERLAAAHEASARRHAGGLWQVERIEAVLRADASDESLTERDAEELARVADALDGAEATLTVVEERVRAWHAERERIGETVEEAEAQAVVEALRRWQRAAATDPASGRRPSTRVFTGLVALALVVALVAVAASVSWLAWIAGVGLGAVGIWWWLTRPLSARDPESFASEATARGARPEAWTDEAVEAEIGNWLTLRARARLAAVATLRAEDAEDARDAAVDTRDHCRIARDARAQRMGLDPQAAMLRGRALGERVVALHRALVARDAARAEAADARARAEAAREEVREALAVFGLADEHGVGAARQRLESARAAARRLREATGALRRAEEQRRASAAALEQAWRRAGVAPPPTGEDAVSARAALQQRLDALPAFRQARDALVAASQQATRAHATLRERYAACDVSGSILDGLLDASWLAGSNRDGRPDLTALDAADAAIRATIDAGATAREERGALRERLDAASRGHTLSDALAAEASAREQAIAARDEAVTVELARWLLERARDEAAEAATPPTLAAAKAWFGRFTHDAFSLTVDSAGLLGARDNRSGEALALEALSDATRVHLLLSLRLAALETGERSAGGGIGCGPLPICLDEVLSTTDAGRFDAVSAALAELGEAGRQVLYLTAAAAEATALRKAASGAHLAPTIHWLGGARGMSLDQLPEAAPDPNARREGESVEDWLARLVVPPIDPWSDVDVVHLAWLLDDHAEQLAALVEARLDRVGPWRRAADAGRPLASLPAPVATTLRARIAALEATLEAWRVGRSRPVSWQQLVDSGAITDAFVDRAREIWERESDPHAVVEAIGALPRFRAPNRERLQEHLVAVGALVDGAPLAEDVITRRAIDAAAEIVDGSAGIALSPWIRRWQGELG